MTYDEAVRTLARWHRESELPPDKIILFRDADEQIVRLVDVAEDTPETWEFYPIQFGRFADMPYVHAVAQVTSAEWEAIQRGEIELPDGWDLDRAELVPEEVAV